MQQLCRTGRWKIIFDEKFVAAKKVKAAKRENHFKKTSKDSKAVGKEAKIKRILGDLEEEKSQTQYFSME